MRTAQVLHRSKSGLAAIGGLVVSTTAAFAAGLGQPEPWQMNRQVPVTAEALELEHFETYLHWLAFGISLFVLGLLIYCIFRFGEKANPTPSRTTHNTAIEIAWTIIPVLILVAVAIPSFRTLRVQLSDPKADVVVKATGHAWYWSYDYPAVGDQKAFTFDANIDEAAEPKMLAVDNVMVVPVNKIVKVQVTSSDVIHSWAMPSFGGKVDAIPGRLNQMWFKATREGTYHGQCSELCGMRHAYMPIVVKVVSEQEYEGWSKDKAQSASNGDGDKFAAK